MQYVNHMEKPMEFSSQGLVWTSYLARGHNIFLLRHRREVTEEGGIRERYSDLCVELNGSCHIPALKSTTALWKPLYLSVSHHNGTNTCTLGR